MKAIDIIATANYGGIGYWGSAEVNGTTVTITSTEGDDFDPITLPIGKVTEAIRATLAKYPNTQAAPDIRQALRDNDPGMIDAEAADMIVQVACFGEIVYG